MGRRERRMFGVGVALILTIYFCLSLPMLDRRGIEWDEQTDLEVASSYLGSLRALVEGSPIDVINVRLPTYSIAVLHRLGFELGLSNARFVSCLVGALAIVATAFFGALALDFRKGLLAASILATSPYFVAYSQLAFTEGDSFVACAVAVVMLAGERFRQAATWIRSGLLGLALGIALSSKISAAAVAAAVAFVVLLPSAWSVRPVGWRGLLRESIPWLVLGLAFGGWLVLQAVASGAILAEWREALPGIALRGDTRYALVMVVWSALIGWAWRSRASGMSATARVAFPLLLALATFFLVPPVHTTNPGIFAGLWRQTFGESTPRYVFEAAALHFAVPLLKSGIVMGAALWLSTTRAIFLLPSRHDLRLPVAVFVFYGAFLLILPWAQTRYMLPLLPTMAIFAADAFVDLMARRWRTAAALGALAIGSIGWDYRLCYPDLNLNGYQWVGARYWAGRSTLGYRSIAQVGSDGASQVLSWTVANAEPGSRVASYLPPRHITRAYMKDAPLQLIDGLSDRDALERADYVLSSLNGEIRSGNQGDDPEGEVFQFPLYDRATLERDFRKVFAVRRAFGIEVASVWRRR